MRVMESESPMGLYETLVLAQLYDAAGRARPDIAFCKRMAAGAACVLDLGCGTGAFAVSISAGRQVVGVDPADQMLQVARGRAGGHAVTWVEGDAATLRLGQVFDLVVLTGHAFQVFLDLTAQRKVLRTIAAHLAPDGQFLFDTRNPDFPGPKERVTMETRRVVQTDHFGAVEMWNASTWDAATGILSYQNHHRIIATGAVHSGTDRILYTSQPDLAGMLEEAGLRVHRWLGDWRGRPFAPDMPEIIPVGGLA
jgi:SAM-dependent methyltransferase